MSVNDSELFRGDYGYAPVDLPDSLANLPGYPTYLDRAIADQYHGIFGSTGSDVAEAHTGETEPGPSLIAERQTGSHVPIHDGGNA